MRSPRWRAVWWQAGVRRREIRSFSHATRSKLWCFFARYTRRLSPPGRVAIQILDSGTIGPSARDRRKMVASIEISWIVPVDTLVEDLTVSSSST